MQSSQGAALPLYVRISERLIREIAAGQLVDGAKLPPERQMARDLDTSVGTLRKALADLETKGLLERRQGSGNYVRQRPETSSVYAFFRLERIGGGGLPTAEILSVERMPKPADAPDFGSSHEGCRIRRLRRLDEHVVALEEIWLDWAQPYVLKADELSESLYLFYRDKLGLVIARVEDRVGLERVPTWSDERFEPSAGDMAGYIERVSWSEAGLSVEYSRTWFDIDKSRYVSRLGKGH